MGSNAFAHSGIKSIRIPNSVENIGAGCFGGCQSLWEVVFEGSPSIEIGAFSDCPLKCVKVAKGVILERNFHNFCKFHKIDLTENE
jgi:hypothetical protein